MSHILSRSWTGRFVGALAFVFFLSSPCLLAQAHPDSGQLRDLFDTVQAQEAGFPLPSTTATITIGTLDLTHLDSIALHDPSRGLAIFYYSGPTYQDPNWETDGAYYTFNVQLQPEKDLPPHYAEVQKIPNEGADISVANIQHLNLRFEIKPGSPVWSHRPTSSITIQLGSQTQTVLPTATEVVFDDVSMTQPSISIAVNGAISVNGQLEPQMIPGLLPARINWRTIGVGVMTIPVLPLAIIFAPVADAEKQNTAGLSQSTVISLTTSVTFSTTDGKSIPMDSPFQTVSDIAKDMTSIGSILKSVKNPVASEVGTGLSVIGDALGSSSETQVVSKMVDQQHTLLFSTTVAQGLTAKSSIGGPGAGDIFYYYYNARVLWYSNNGKMSLLLLGFDGDEQPSASQLASAYVALRTKPAGTMDPNLHLDLSSIKALLNLDPFISISANGDLSIDPGAPLASPRFVPADVDGARGTIEMGAGQRTVAVGHTRTSTDLNATALTTASVETDVKAFLAFLGVGVPQTQILQSQITQTSSTENAVGQTITDSFTLNANGHEYYSCEVYYDNVFGAFVFRDMTAVSNEPAVSGTVLNHGVAVPNSLVTVLAGSRRFTTTSGADGKYALRLPGFKSGHLTVATGVAAAQAEYEGKPVRISLQNP
jgi:hypothetical protein